MEDKTLNFDRPFLSVRRRTPTLQSEQGHERKTSIPRPAVPRLPAHRSELKSGPIRNPGSVPFLWEQTPGQPKEEAKPSCQSHDGPPATPKLPPGRYSKANQNDCDRLSSSSSVGGNQVVNVPSTGYKKEPSNVCDESVKNVKSSKETTEEKESSDSEDSDAFVDALDTLSRTVSIFLNCSTSGLNELDNVDVESAGNFLTDPQAQKFMMDRFLPAAKAMASDTVHYAPKRQPVVPEQPKQVNKGVNQSKPSLRYGPSFAKRYSEYCDNEAEEYSEDDDDPHENTHATCGLLSRFCLKGSIGRLNPIPGMGARTRGPISSPYKTQRRSSSSAGSYSETDSESKSDRTERKLIENALAAEIVERKTQMRNDGKQFKSRTIATYCGVTQLFLETKEVPGGPEEQIHADNNDSGLYEEGVKTSHKVLADQDSLKDSGSGSPIVEKTLYVDTVQKLESPNLIFSSHDLQDIKGHPNWKDNHGISTKRTDQIQAADSTADDFEKLDEVGGEEKSLPNAKKCDDSNISSPFDKPNGPHGMEMPNTSTIAGTTGPVKATAEKLENKFPSHSELLGPPPLPKSPSDSWLLRTLPCVSKNASVRSHFSAAKSPRSHGSNAAKNDVKWETIVKTTKLQHRHSHHSTGVLTTIPEA